MLSKEKLQEALEVRVAELMAEQVYQRLKTDLQEQWDKVIYELATTRKNNEHLKESIGNFINYTNRLQELIQQLEAKEKITTENQRKAAEILKAATKEMGLSE